MPAHRMDADTLRAALRALDMCGGSKAEAARRLGIARETLRDQIAAAHERSITTEDDTNATRRAALRGEIGGPPIPHDGRPPEGFVVTQNSAAYDENGNLLRQWVGTKRDAGVVYEVPVGHIVKGESALVGPEGRVMARWVKTREGAGEGLVEALRVAFSEYEGRAGEIPAPLHTDEDLLTVYPLPDLHLGMLAWGRETGASYDMKIASDIAIRSIEALVAQSRQSRHAVLVGLGDFYHNDSQTNQTPGSGHQLDVDSRWSKIFATGAKLATTLVDILARKHEQVEVRWLSGNHDVNSAMCLSVALSLFYSNNPRITVDDDPGIAYYRRFGKCLIGANHGHTMKTADRMAMAMAVDCAADWGATEHRHIFAGHLHHERMKETAGVRVETLGSPAARDAWNAASGYRSNRSISAITFHKEDGEIGRHRVNISGPAQTSRPNVVA